MYTRSMFNTADIEQQRNLLNRMAELVDAGRIKTTLGKHFGLINASNLKKAHVSIESGSSIGKVVLEGF